MGEKLHRSAKIYFSSTLTGIVSGFGTLFALSASAPIVAAALAAITSITAACHNTLNKKAFKDMRGVITQNDAIKLRGALHDAQQKLNKLMGKEISRKDAAFTICNELHSLLGKLRDQLTDENFKNLSTEEVTKQLKYFEEKLEEAKKAAK